MKLISLIFALVAATSCQQPEPIAQEAKPAGQQDSADRTDTSPNENTQQFYPIAGERPDEVCGLKGFTYLAEGYLFKECGTCHYQSNQFSVTEFAVRNDLSHSYDVMARLVDKNLFIEATTKNPFCSDCLLGEDDPLLADLIYFTQHVKDEDCQSSL